MQISLNGKNVEVKNGTNLLDLLLEKDLEPERVVVEYNFNILLKEEWGKTILKENDNLEVLRFVGGG